jgi:hypothetical protein
MKASPIKTSRAQSLARLGSILLASNNPDKAVAPLEESVPLFREAQLPESPETADAVASLQRARTLLKQAP